ncbi:hypothetical protein SDC9_209857 [bioreactor metagenome]|uniref:Uncharacterized protein n=1 Tax=bioreactor metagenome TaxID=1076179 RepID=A0A645JG76_9ZZZZ
MPAGALRIDSENRHHPVHYHRVPHPHHRSRQHRHQHQRSHQLFPAEAGAYQKYRGYHQENPGRAVVRLQRHRNGER